MLRRRRRKNGATRGCTIGEAIHMSKRVLIQLNEVHGLADLFTPQTHGTYQMPSVVAFLRVSQGPWFFRQNLRPTISRGF